MVRAAQKGEMENPSSEILDVADDISVKDAKKMAKTKHKGLPEKVKEEKLLERHVQSIKSRVKKGKHKLYKLDDVNKPAEKQSMQDVGGFRGVHGASRKSKAAQGKPAPVVYSYKKKEVVDEGTGNVVAAKKALLGRTKCADCGSYSHASGSSLCPKIKDREGLPEGVMDIVRKYSKKKEEKKPQKAMDAGARAKRKLQRREYAAKVSGSEDNVPDELRDHKTWSEFKKYLAI